MRLAVVIVTVAGCSFPTPSADYVCATDGDCVNHPGTTCSPHGFCVVVGPEPIDDAFLDSRPLDAFELIDCHDWSITPAHFDPCLIGPVPMDNLDLSLPGTYVYETIGGTLRGPGNVPLPTPSHLIVMGSQLISIGSLKIGQNSTLRVIGDKPLIIVSWSTIEVVGVIDASSVATEAGAGANPQGCAGRPAVAGGTNPGGGGGGGGGGYQGTGGSGGTGQMASPPVGSPGAGGPPILPPITSLLGGCPGAAGGAGSMQGGSGGSGGGAIQLTSRSTMTISGTVHAGGAGGRGALAAGAPGNGGGGGGGAGGLVGLAAPLIQMSGILAANGGGGGEGADISSGQGPGGAGQDGSPSLVAATGGIGGAAGNGGAGSVGGTLGGGIANNDDTDGGGGGGGGAGFVIIRSPIPQVSGIVSPPATLP